MRANIVWLRRVGMYEMHINSWVTDIYSMFALGETYNMNVYFHVDI